MESFFALLQNNVLDRRTWDTREELRIAIVTWIERTYHRRRRQQTLGRRSASIASARETLIVPDLRMRAKPEGSGGFGFEYPDALVDVGQGAGEGGEVELIGLVFGEFEWRCLEVVDLAADLNGVEGVAVGEQFGDLGR